MHIMELKGGILEVELTTLYTAYSQHSPCNTIIVREDHSSFGTGPFFKACYVPQFSNVTQTRTLKSNER